MTTTEALQAALRIEHEVVYGYGVAGAHLRGATQRRCRHRLDEHLVLRDQLAALVRAAGGRPAPARPAYALPAPVSDIAAAAGLLARLEDGSAGAMWDVTAAVPAGHPARRTAVSALVAAATWGARWRAVTGGAEPALPGHR